MEYIGIIEPASKPFTRDDWLDYIAKDDCLVSAEPREICNPANGQMIVVWPNPDSVGLFVEGKELGGFSWSQSEDPLLVILSIEGCENQVRAYAIKIAQAIGGQVQEELD
ncbi:MAG: hypothetical protein SFV81_27605 [Pirellulaceae bacterium]|nr:hypothetical protein [Pirellulaceae bacterium]